MQKTVVSASIFLLKATLFATAVLAQKPASAPSTAATAGNTGITGTGTTGTRGNNTPNSNTGSYGDGYSVQRPVFLSGSVIFDDGAPANNEIRIERVCNGSSHLEAHTDTKGRFSFQVGAQNAMGIADADMSSDGLTPSTGRRSNSGMGQSTQTTTRMGEDGFGSGRGLMGCELRASYPGYVSESVDLSTRHSMDDPKVGVIVLHRLVNVKGTTISVVSAQAPKAAQKNYEKGLQLMQKGKLDEAAEHFQNATTEYPKYALAWFDLGRLQQRVSKLDDAKASYLAAAAADPHFVSPYDALALLSAQQGRWEETAKYSKSAIELNPVEFPSSFWYNALANYNLKNNAEAEKSARALTKLDNRHHYPEVETLLAEFAASKGDVAEAANHLKTYLTLAPDAKNAAAVKRELERMEQTQAAQAQPGAAQLPPK